MLGCGTLLATWLTQWLTGAGAYFRYARWPTVLYLLFWASAFWAWGAFRPPGAGRPRRRAGRPGRAPGTRPGAGGAAGGGRRVDPDRPRTTDVIAHHLSAMVIQAGAARRRLDDDPEQTRAALAGARGLPLVRLLLWWCPALGRSRHDTPPVIGRIPISSNRASQTLSHRVDTARGSGQRVSQIQQRTTSGTRSMLAIHFHAVMRLDAAGPQRTCPACLQVKACRQALAGRPGGSGRRGRPVRRRRPARVGPPLPR
jgi:hypothetical protein